ncbi:TPA: hypothetical protein N0F65_009450 [Lagenidium giganteum]|uniref:Uncharacterized protein n=1 Tax=Lagenidium giganteum TaxID=4803 RepID=A0AAV2ZAV2_9STRA|nr:TPA: hypothetical protein N0F65_009450 [Lagenidium giganteum]
MLLPQSTERNEDEVAGYIYRLLDPVCNGTNLVSTTAIIARIIRYHVKLDEIAHRGRWSMECFATLLEYLAETSTSDQKVARVLIAWADPTQFVVAPTLTSVPEVKEIQERFASQLFALFEARLQSSQFVHALATTLLLYVRDLLQFGIEHCVNKTLHVALGEVLPGTSSSKLTSILITWCDEIRKRFVVSKLAALPTSKLEPPITDGRGHTRLASGLLDAKAQLTSIGTAQAEPAAALESLGLNQRMLLTAIQRHHAPS